jgi:hypothetical protein
VSDGHTLGLNGESLEGFRPPERQHVVEQHGVHAAIHQVLVRMHIVFVGDGRDAVFTLRTEKDLVGEGCAQRSHATTGEILQRVEPRGVGVAHGKHFAELVVRQRDGHGRPEYGRVLDPAQTDLRVAAADGLDDRREGDEHELRCAAQAPGEKVGDLHVESHQLVGIVGAGLHVRRTAFRIACPAERLAGGLRRRRRGVTVTKTTDVSSVRSMRVAGPGMNARPV